ncbi:MAG TPA: hypothetical protein VFI65_29560 [Streptosporangiaceae bacterium]|nr:hypothetical protein [Streptosporangiaceae bacterium]
MNTGGFRGAGRELTVAACFVIALAVAAWILFGPATSGIVVLFCAAIGLVVLRTLVNRPPKAEDLAETRHDVPATSFAGFWRMQTDIASAIASLSAWDDNTRRRMQNLLAARLAERHGISLAADPQAARLVFIGDRHSRAELWYWIDPQRPTPSDAASRRGIPPRVLTALIHRLEQL